MTVGRSARGVLLALVKGNWEHAPKARSPAGPYKRLGLWLIWIQSPAVSRRSVPLFLFISWLIFSRRLGLLAFCVSINNPLKDLSE